MNILSRFLRERKAGANAILGVVILLCGMMMVMLLMEIGRLYVIADKVQNDLDSSNAAVWAVIDRTSIASGVLQFHSSTESRTTGVNRSRTKFIEYLRKNMELDASLKPIDADKFIAGPVSIQSYEVYLASDLPLTNSDGIYINKVSVYSKINVPVKLMFPMFGETYQLTVKRVTNLEDDL